MEKGSNKEARAEQESTGHEEESPGVVLKPIVYSTSSLKRGAPNKIQQMMLLKALQVTSDAKELRRMIGVRTVADVYRTLDKLVLRREYHKALDDNGLSFDYIVKNIKQVIDSAEKDSDKLNAIKTLLKSVGMDRYEAEAVGSGSTWEETLLKAAESKKGEVGGGTVQDLLEEEYSVTEPEIPDYVKKIQSDGKELGDSLYG